MVWADHNLFIHSSVDGQLDCFCSWAVVINAAVNVRVHIFYQHKFSVL